MQQRSTRNTLIVAVPLPGRGRGGRLTRAEASRSEQQTELQAGGLQIIQALCAMNVVDRLAAFNSTRTLQQISSKFLHYDAIVPNGHRILLRDGKPSPARSCLRTGTRHGLLRVW